LRSLFDRIEENRQFNRKPCLLKYFKIFVRFSSQLGMISIVQVKVQLAEYMTEVIELPIERFEAFEEQLGIKLEGLFASFDSEEGYISVSRKINLFGFHYKL
jgi:hypothetical protein